MTAEIIEQTVRQYFAGICAMDPEAWVAVFAEDAVSHDPVGTPPLVGHAALRRAMQDLCDAVEQVGRYADHIFIAGNGAAIKWTGRCIGRNGRGVGVARERGWHALRVHRRIFALLSGWSGEPMP